MLLELAIGDAYGAGFEYANPGYVTTYNNLRNYTKHPSHSLRPGCYTDDTQMSIAITEAIISGEAWTPLMLAQHFVEAFQRDPRQGYAGGFYNFLLKVRDGRQFLDEIGGDSDKSGAAMRAGPVGIYPTIEEVIEKSKIQAAITHNSPAGINAAIAAALMTHYFLYKPGPKRDLGRFLSRHTGGQWAQTWTGKVGPKGWMSVHAAVTTLTMYDSLSGILRQCVAFTGDVDTVATIALAAASCSDEIDQDLPEPLVENLENGPYGREYLIRLNDRLLALKANQ